MKYFKDVSRSSPKRGDRACFCKDSNTYSKKCCDGFLWSQGIGSISIAPSVIVTEFLLQQDGSFLLQQDLNKIII